MIKRWGGGGGEGRKRLQTNSWILKTAHTHELNVRPSVAEVNFEPKQTLTCQNIPETKSVRRRNFNDSGRLMQAFKVKFGNLNSSYISTKWTARVKF